MGLFSMLKRNSKLALKNNWGGAILIVLIIFGVSMMINVLRQITISVFVDGITFNEILSDFMIDPGQVPLDGLLAQSITTEWIIMGIFGVLSLIFIAPLSLGQTRWFFRLVHGERMQVSEVFSFFETLRRFGRSVWYYINIYVRTLLWSILFFTVPGGILGVSVYFLSGGEELPRSSTAIASTGLFLAVILMILAGIFYAACINRYSLTAYFLAESDEITVRKAIRESLKYTKGFRFSLLWFELSFLGWGLLCVLAFPLLLYVLPYFNTAYAMYARYIIEKNRYSEPNATREFVAANGEAPPPVPPAQFAPVQEQEPESTVPSEPIQEPEPPANDGGMPE